MQACNRKGQHEWLCDRLCVLYSVYSVLCGLHAVHACMWCEVCAGADRGMFHLFPYQLTWPGIPTAQYMYIGTNYLLKGKIYSKYNHQEILL